MNCTPWDVCEGLEADRWELGCSCSWRPLCIKPLCCQNLYMYSDLVLNLRRVIGLMQLFQWWRPWWPWYWWINYYSIMHNANCCLPTQCSRDLNSQRESQLHLRRRCYLVNTNFFGQPLAPHTCKFIVKIETLGSLVLSYTSWSIIQTLEDDQLLQVIRCQLVTQVKIWGLGPNQNPIRSSTYHIVEVFIFPPETGDTTSESFRFSSQPFVWAGLAVVIFVSALEEWLGF